MSDYEKTSDGSVSQQERDFRAETGLFPPGRDAPAADPPPDASETTYIAFGIWLKKRRAEADRDALLAACEAANRRFSEQNGEVSYQVWCDNWPAIDKLRAAIRQARQGDQQQEPAHDD